MPYFSEIEELSREVNLWADLRKEQGAPIGGVLRELRKELRAARAAIRRAKPPRERQERGPNGFDAIRQARPKGPRLLAEPGNIARLKSRMKGAWLGRAAGCTLGAPVELWPVERMERLAGESGAAFPPTDYWPDHPNKDGVRYGASTFKDYLRGSIKAIPVDDDLAYTVLGLLILEEYGPEFTTANVAEAWLNRLPVACTAEEVALRNLKGGVDPDRAAEVDNPYQHWIGAGIRSDPWGYACPGQPERAAAMAYQDAYLSHRRDGIYGAMLFSAAIAAAFAVGDPIEAVEIGLTEIPARCELARDVKWALRAGATMTGYQEARAAVDKRFAGMHPVHTNNNACLTVFGLFIGGKDFTRTIGSVVAMGLDNDCTAATAGSLLGAVLGIEQIPSHWWKPFRNRCQTYLNGVPELKNTDIVERFLAVVHR